MTDAPDAEEAPLQDIEREVQARAKGLDLDAAGADGRSRLRSLVDDAVGRWAEEHRRGRRTVELVDPEAVAERAFRNLAGYGPLEPLLHDPDVWEIMVNAPDQIFVKRHRGRTGYHDEVFHDDEHVLRTLTKILDDAATAHRTLDPTEGLQDAQLDDGSRIHIVHGDIARGGHVLVNIRRFVGVRYRTLAELDPSLRVVVAEEVFEADVPLPNVAQMQTRPTRGERRAVDLRRLVAGFLRMAPDVAIVGEVRDREALPLLLTLSSGVTGFTTIHAGSARQALTRLRFVCQLADTSSELPLSALNTLVTESIDVVVHSARTGNGVEVTEIACVENLAGSSEATQFTLTEVFAKPGAGERLAWSGELPVRAARALRDAGYDVRALLGAAPGPNRPAPPRPPPVVGAWPPPADAPFADRNAR